MSGRKALFFDVDGTLVSEVSGQVPESAVLALAKARKNGHLVFINTGRVRCHVEALSKTVCADGYVCGCGTYIEAEGRVLYEHRIPYRRGMQIKDDILKYGLDGVLEGQEYCHIQGTPSRMAPIEELKDCLRACSGVLSPVTWQEEGFRYDKFFLMADGDSDKAGFFKTLGQEFEITDRRDGFYEFVPAGHSKATAIRFILERYRIDPEDAWVFGDSTNDLSMFAYAKNAVLMGQHDQELEPYATFLTKRVEEDGIAYAMEKLGMI